MDKGSTRVVGNACVNVLPGGSNRTHGNATSPKYLGVHVLFTTKTYFTITYVYYKCMH